MLIHADAAYARDAIAIFAFTPCCLLITLPLFMLMPAAAIAYFTPYFSQLLLRYYYFSLR